MPLPSGRRRDRIQIMQPVVAAGKQTFQPWQKAWGYVEPQRSVELAAALGPENMNWYLVTLPFIPGVRPKMRLQYTSPDGVQVLEIAGVSDVNSRHYELQLNCTQVTS